MLDYAEICGKLQNVRKCVENNKLCGNVRKTVNCAIPHPSHLIGASVTHILGQDIDKSLINVIQRGNKLSKDINDF